MWLGGDSPSKDDAEAFQTMQGEQPNGDTHPNTLGWWLLCYRFTEEVRNSWPAAAAPAPAKGGKKEGGKQQNQP